MIFSISIIYDNIFITSPWQEKVGIWPIVELIHHHPWQNLFTYLQEVSSEKLLQWPRNFHRTLNVMLRATSHTRLGARDQHTSSTLIGRKGGGRSRSKFASHHTWGTNRVQDGCKLYINSYQTSNGSHFTVTWIIFKNHLLEVGLTLNQETTTLRTLTTVDSFYFYHTWGPACKEIHWNSIWLRARSHMASHYTWESMTTLHDVGGVVGTAFEHFRVALTISWSRLVARVWSGP